tara:strand:+ start:1260 stop:1613 length:354 start_codon:yes stop_codon:yes gene_type:complete
MTILGLANTRGKDVTIQTASVSADDVNTDAYTFSDTETVRAYVADAGQAVQMMDEGLQAPRSVTVYIPSHNTNVTLKARLKIDSVIYQIDTITYPGFKTTGALAYTIVAATSDVGAS